MIYFSLIAFANLAGLILLLRISESEYFFSFRGSAANPLFFFVFLSIFFNIDFYVLWESDGLQMSLYEIPLEIKRSDVLYAYLHYTLLFWSACTGICFSHAMWLRSGFSQQSTVLSGTSKAQRRSSTFILVILFLLGIYCYFQLIELSGVGARQVIFREQRWLIVSMLFLTPALSIYLASNSPSIYFSSAVTSLAALIMYSTGTRGHVIYLGLVFITFLQLREYKIGKKWLFIAIPFIALFLIMERFVRRYSGTSNNFSEFLGESDGIFSLFFHTGEISMAESITTIVLELENFDRLPFESFLGLALYPFPRSVISFKPFGSSAEFSEYVAPVRRAISGSELTTTGYGDLIMQFGLYFSPIVLSVMAYYWHRHCLRTAARGFYVGMLWMPVTIWCMYIFLRSGLFDVGSAFWYFILIFGLYGLIGKLVLRVGR